LGIRQGSRDSAGRAVEELWQELVSHVRVQALVCRRGLAWAQLLKVASPPLETPADST
jgi:hypothetical protein